MKNLIYSLTALFFAGCADLKSFEVNTLPSEVQEEIRNRDPRLLALYEKHHPVPAPGLHFKSTVRPVVNLNTRDVGFEAWIYVSGSW